MTTVKKSYKEITHQSNYNRIRSKKDFEVKPKNDVSLTVPGQSYTVRELLRKHIAGIHPAIGKIPIWDEHPTFDSWDATIGEFDLVDAQEMAMALEERKNEILEARERVKRSEKKSIDEKLAELETLKKKLEKEQEGTLVKDLDKS